MAFVLTGDGDLSVLDLGDGDNRLDRAAIAELHRHLDDVESRPEPRALLTVASGKVWCNGFDQEWMAAHPGEVDLLLDDLRHLLARLTVLAVPTVAAVQGHAFAAGAMLAFAHDFRVVRRDRGYLCLPEIDLRRALSPASVALVQAKVPPAAWPDLLIAARRFGGPEAVEAGLASRAVPEEEVRTVAAELAASLAGKDAATLATVKQRLYGAVAERMSAG
jgi:Delta3-Delta2-enoyl-CoA isomerase